MISIYTVAFHQIHLLQFMYTQLQKYCVDKFKFNVINNGKTEQLKQEIKNFCKTNAITCIDINVEYTDNGSRSHAQAFEYVQKKYIPNDTNEIIVFLDQDIFAYKSFSFLDILENADIAGMYQYRHGNDDIKHEYISAIFIILKNFEDLSTFSWHDGVGDSGSWTNWFFKNNKKIKLVQHTPAIDIETEFIFTNHKLLKQQYLDKYRSQFISNCFFHYYRGGMWSESDSEYHKQKWNFTKYFIENINNYVINLDECVWYDKAHAQKGHNGVDHLYRGYKFTKRFPETKLYVEGQD